MASVAGTGTDAPEGLHRNEPFDGVFQPMEGAFPWHAWQPLGGETSNGWSWPLGAADEGQENTTMNAAAAPRDIFALLRNPTHAEGHLSRL